MASAIFIVGCGHSGTSIVARLLGEHSMVHAIPGETGIMERGECLPGVFAEFNKAAGVKQYWLEKSPKHILHIGRIWGYLPAAKIINVIRDPRDTYCSFIARGFKHRPLERWITHNEAYLKHVPDARLKTVCLEHLVDRPVEVINDLLAFLCLPVEDLLGYHRRPVSWYTRGPQSGKPDPSNHKALRNWQINQPLFSSTRRWQTDLTPEGRNVLSAQRDRVWRIVEAFGQPALTYWAALREFLYS